MLSNRLIISDLYALRGTPARATNARYRCARLRATTRLPCAGLRAAYNRARQQQHNATPITGRRRRQRRARIARRICARAAAQNRAPLLPRRAPHAARALGAAWRAARWRQRTASALLRAFAALPRDQAAAICHSAPWRATRIALRAAPRAGAIVRRSLGSIKRRNDK